MSVGFSPEHHSNREDTLAHINQPINPVQPITRSTTETEKCRTVIKKNTRKIVETNRSSKKRFVADLRENSHGQGLCETLTKNNKQ